ncbi:DUF1735 domain-containing protein [Zhouia sp. PK063]|uniref:DUF1735 domain-containing protein n=1 Tax=Zhouia sp. PK063 TaxID=3373602 RepID=UPI0037A5EC28
MKKNIYKSLIACVALLGVYACSDETGPYVSTYQVIELDGVPRSGSELYPISTNTVEAVETDSVKVTVNYAGEKSAPEDITVNIEINDQAIADYNASEDANYTALDPSLYGAIPSTVTIKKGESSADFYIPVYPNSFDLNLSNALAITISSASSGTISGNYGTRIYYIPVKNEWEGTYTQTVHWIAGVAEQTYSTKGVYLNTVGPTKNHVNYIGYYFGGNTYYEFNADGTVTATNGYGCTMIKSNYDKTTHNFYVHYTFIGTKYELEETYTRTGD